MGILTPSGWSMTAVQAQQLLDRDLHLHLHLR